MYYPIVSKASEYKATRAGKIKGVRQEVIDAIDATEPYPGGKGEALWQLNELNKPDKHELLIGAAAFNVGVDLSVDVESMFGPGDFSTPERFAEFKEILPLFFVAETRAVPLEVGDEIYIEPLDDKMQKDRRFSFAVSLNAPGVIQPEPAIKTLKDMANLVRDTVETLGKLLARLWPSGGHKLPPYPPFGYVKYKIVEFRPGTRVAIPMSAPGATR